MFNLSRMTAGFAVVALLTTACNTDSNGPSSSNGLSSLNLSADRNDNDANGSNGSSSGFSVLANAAVTCTDGNITGNVGTYFATPTGSITQTGCPVTGSLLVGDSVAQQAFNDFLNTYAALAPKPEDVCTMLTGTLAGATLAPGAYCFPAAATLTGLLTLDGPADGIWTFKIGTSGTGALTGICL